MDSRSRQSRVDALLSGTTTTAADPRAILRDHSGYPRSICRHPTSDPETGRFRTVMSVVIEPQEGRLHVSRGNPCERPYETYALS
jgi:isopenicillin-N N-acyltransferase-like protein